MKTQLIIAACLACAATTAPAQTRLGSGVVGTIGSGGALTDVGGSAYGARPLPSEPSRPGAIDPRTGVHTAPSAPASSAPANAGGLEQSPTPPARPVIDGAVWGSPRPNPAPESNRGQGNN